MARSLGWSFVDLLLAWHLHATVGLSGQQTGGLLFAFLALAGGATFVAGLTFSRRRATGKSIVQVQLLATIASAALLWVQFSVVDVSVVVASGAAFRIAYAIQDVAQNMLASLLPADDVEVRRYARARVTLAAVARCAVIGGYALVMPDTLPILLAGIGSAMIASAFALRGVVFPERHAVCRAEPDALPAWPAGLPVLLATWAIAAMLLPTLNRLLIFAPSIGGLPRSGAWLLGGFCVGAIVGPMVRRPVSGSFMLVMIVASGLILIAPLPGGLRVAGAVGHGIAISIVGVRLWAATSRMAIEDARRGRSSDGIIFGSVILTIHLASAAGMLMLGPLIEGFETGSSESGILALMLTIAGALLIALVGITERTAPAAA